MNTETTPITQPDASTINGKANSAILDARVKAAETLATYEEKIRQSPDKAVLIALAAGYCLQVLPAKSMVTAPLRLAAMLIKPSLLGLGAMKAYEIYQDQKSI